MEWVTIKVPKPQVEALEKLLDDEIFQQAGIANVTQIYVRLAAKLLAKLEPNAKPLDTAEI